MVKSLTTRHRFPILFDEFRHELGHLFDHFGWEEGEASKDWFAPSINVAESETAYEISLDLPGMKPDEFEVEFKDGQLWISGQRKHESEEQGKTWHRVERSYGKFRRVVSLGNEVDAEKVTANYTDGVLLVSVPKAPEAQVKRIEVKS